MKTGVNRQASSGNMHQKIGARIYITMLALIFVLLFSTTAAYAEETSAPPQSAPTTAEQQSPDAIPAETAQVITTETQAQLFEDSGTPPETVPEPAQLEDNGEVEKEEDYSIPEGSAKLYINGQAITGESYKNDTANNAITNALMGAAANLAQTIPSSASGMVEIDISVSAGAYEGGLDLTEGSALHEQLKTAINAYLSRTTSTEPTEPAPENEITDLIFDANTNPAEVAPFGNITLRNDAADGSAAFHGNILIDGFNLLMTGLYLTNEERIKISNAQSLSYTGTSLDDSVVIETENVKSITIDTGAGDDNVQMCVTQSPTVGIGIGSKPTAMDIANAAVNYYDQSDGSWNGVTDQVLRDFAASVKSKVQAAVDAASSRVPTTISISTGDGEDNLALKVVNSSNYYAGDPTKIDPRTGAPYFAYGFDLDLGGTTLNVDMGAGADDVSVTGGVTMLMGRNILKSLTEMIAAHYPGTTDMRSTFNIDGGAGDDTVSVNTTAAFHNLFGLDVNVAEEAGGGYDRLHLTGHLANEYIYNEDDKLAPVDYADRIALTDSGLTLIAQAEIKVLAGIGETLGLDDNPITAAVAMRQRMNVYFDANVEAVTDLLESKRVIEWTGDALTTQSFTDYTMSADIMPDGIFRCSNLVTGSGTLANLIIKSNAAVLLGTLLVPDLTLIVISPDIRVGPDPIYPDIGIEIQAKHIIFIASSEDTNLTPTVEVMNDELTGQEIQYGIQVMEATEIAKISIASGSTITAAGLVDMQANTRQTEGMLDIAAGASLDIPNFVIVKIGVAAIDIQGSITATSGYVHAIADTYTNFKATDLLALIPVSFGWADVAASVTLSNNASISAGAGVALMSNTVVFVSAVDQGSFPVVNISLAGIVASADTKTEISGSSSVTAGGDVRIDARNRTKTEAVSLAKATDVLAQPAKSGIFLAVNVAFAETRAAISDNASVISGGELRIEADSLLRARTYAISSPVSVYAQDANGNQVVQTQTASIQSTVTMIEQILGRSTKETSGVRAKLVGGITGSNSLASKVGKGVTEDDKETTPSVQAVGALGLSVINNTIEALIETSGTVKSGSGSALLLRAFGETLSETRGDGSLYNNSGIAFIPGYGQVQRTNEASNAAAGVGVIVSVFSHSITAEIRSGSIYAGTVLDVSAISRRVDSCAVAKAGHIPSGASFGLGGAIAVHIVTVRSTAAIRKQHTIDSDSGLRIVPANYYIGDNAAIRVLSKVLASRLETVGDASGKRVRRSIELPAVSVPLEDSKTYGATSMGVGAGIAVAVTGVDVTAIVEDGVVFNNYDGSTVLEKALGSIEIAAFFDGTERVVAAAGSAGGISVTPVSATGVSGVMTMAYLGSVNDNTQRLNLYNGLSLTAQGKITRFIKADAAASGAKVGVGATVAVGVYNDSATAELKRTIKARGGVYVGAASVSRVTETVKAAVSGAGTTPAAPGSGTPAASGEDTEKVIKGEVEGKEATEDPNAKAEADKTADKKMDNAGKLANDVNTKNTNGTSVNNAKTKRQRFEAMEGSVQVAAGIAVNVLDNLSRAEIFSGVDVIAEGDVSVISRNDTDATVKANASTTDSLNGVGVAVAVNDVDHQNIARVGDGRISGINITVSAEIYEKAESNALEKAMKELVDYLMQEGLLDEMIDEAIREAYLGSVEGCFRQLLQQTTLNEADREIMAALVQKLIDIVLWQENLPEAERQLHQNYVVNGAGQLTLKDRIKALIVEKNLTQSDAYGMEQYVLSALQAHYTGTANTVTCPQASACGELIDELKILMEYAAEAAEDRFEVQLLVGRLQRGDETLTTQELARIDRYLNVSLTDDEGAPRPAEKTEAERRQRVTDLKKLTQQEIVSALTQEGTDAVDAVWSVYIESLGAAIDDILEAFADPEMWSNVFTLNENNILVIELPSFGGTKREITQLTIAADKLYGALVLLLADRFGAGRELDGVGHTISTQAISGVGASNVGVAGALAITVIDTLSEASIKNRDTLSADADVIATELLRVEADEAQKIYTTATGSADKNLGNGAKARTANSPGSSVGIGASFSLNMIKATVLAFIGDNRNVSAGSVEVRATLRDDVETNAVAGSDPIGRRDAAQQAIPTLGSDPQKVADAAAAAALGTNTKDISFDASIALAIVENTVTAEIRPGKLTTTNADEPIKSGIFDGENYKMADILVQATVSGVSYTGASAFSAGSKTSVGACAGVSIVKSDILASLRSPTTAAGSVRVYAATVNADENTTLATSVGASVDRLLEKLRNGLAKVSLHAGATSNLSGKVVNLINGLGANTLQTKVSAGTSGTLNKASKNVPFTTNILKAFNIDTKSELDDAKKKAGDAGNDAGKEADNTTPGTSEVESSPSTLNVAAAVAFSLTAHNATAEIKAPVTAGGDVEAAAENRANFRTRASGASITASDNANVVSAAVAITINRNKASSEITGQVTAGKDVIVSAYSTQNTDGNYIAYMSAQAVAASVSTGLRGSLGVAGAVAVLVNHADTIARIGDGSVISAKNVSVGAIDLSKLAIRATGMNVGKQSFGIGAAFAIMYAESTIHALVGDNVTITANDMQVIAKRLLVDESMYKFPFSWNYLFTMNVTDERSKGLLNVTLPSELSKIKEIKIEITLGSDNIVDVLDMINYLATVNYYVEAISGSIVTGASASNAAVAGTVAALHTNNDIKAQIGENANITLTVADEGNGSLIVAADSGATTRVIAGSASVSNAKVGVGTVISVADMSDTVAASILNNNAEKAITAGGSVAVTAKGEYDVWDVSVADSMTAGANNKATIGGGINVAVSDTSVKAKLGDGVRLTAAGGLDVTAENKAQISIIAFSMSAAFGNSTVAAGGTFAAAVNNNLTVATIGDNAVVSAQKIRAAADSSDAIMHIMASASGAASSSANVAGTVGVSVLKSLTEARAGKGVSLTSTSGNIEIHAENNADLVVVLVSLAASGKTSLAAGASVLTQVFKQQVYAIAGVSGDETVTEQGASLIAHGGSIVIDVLAANRAISVAAAGQASGTGTLALAGTILTNISKTDALALLGNNTTATADDSVGVLADATIDLISSAGSITLSGATAGVGASVNTADIENSVQALIGDWSRVTAYAFAPDPTGTYGIATSNRTERRRGVVVHAFMTDNVIMTGVSGAAAKGLSGAGVVDTLLIANTVRAHVGNNTRVSSGLRVENGKDLNNDGNYDSSDGAGEIDVEAQNYSRVVNFGGALSISAGNAAVGATGVTIAFDKSVFAALLGETERVSAESSISVTADNKSELFLLAVTAGVSAGTAAITLGGNILIFEDYGSALISGYVSSRLGSISVLARSDTDLYNIGASLALSGNAGVSGVAVVTYFTGTLIAQIVSGEVKADIGSVVVKAESDEFVTADGAGIAGGGTAGVSGTVDVIITKINLQATIQNGVKVNAASLQVLANDRYELWGVAATVALGGTAGVGVTAIITIARNTVTANIGESCTVNTSGDTEISAKSDRRVSAYAGTAAGGGTAGVGAVVMVTVIGAKLTKDVTDALQGNFNIRALLYGVNGINGMNARTPQQGLRYTAQGGSYDAGTIENDMAPDTNNYSGTSVDSAADREQAASIMDGVADYAPTDSTMAYIGGMMTTVNSGGKIIVSADDNLVASMFTAAVTVGGTAGVGVGVAVAVLNSNVLAYTGEGSYLTADGDISIIARGGSRAVTPEDDSKDDLSISFLNDNDINVSDMTIHAVSVSLAGGTVGVGAAVGVVTMSSNIYAYLRSVVYRANILTVQAECDYKNIVAATLAVGAGAVGVSASVGVSLFTGNTYAAIEKSAFIKSAGTVRVNSKVDNTCIAVATGLAAGGVAVNGAVAAAVNNSRTETFIARGVNLTVSGDIYVTADVHSRAYTYIMGFALGGVSVGACVAVSVLRPTVYTYVGKTPKGDITGASDLTLNGKITALNLTVQNSVNTYAESMVLSVNPGVIAVGGNVLLVFNYTDSLAAINGTNAAITEKLLVQAGLDAQAKSELNATVAGGIVVGVTVSHVLLESCNQAILDLTGATITAERAEIRAVGNSSKAIAHAVSGFIAVTGAGCNVAVADNHAANNALVKGAGAITVQYGLNVYSYLDALAEAKVFAANTGAIIATNSTALALARFTQEASICDSTVVLLSQDVLYSVRVEALGKTAANSLVEGMELTLAGIEIAANVAESNITATLKAYVHHADITAYKLDIIAKNNGADEDNTGAAARVGAYGGTGVRLVGVVVNEAKAINNVNIKYYISDSNITDASIINLSDRDSGGEGSAIRATAEALTGDNISLVNVGVMHVTASAQGSLDAYINLGEGYSITGAGTIYVLNRFKAYADALTSAAGSLDIAAVKFQTNSAHADVTTAANAYISGGGTVQAAVCTVQVLDMECVIYAHSATPQLSVSIAGIAVNQTEALKTMRRNCFVETIGSGSFTFGILHVLNGDTDSLYSKQTLISDVSACAGIASSDANNDALEIGLIIGSANRAVATASTIASSHVKGAVTVTDTLEITARNLSPVEAKAVTGRSFALISVGGLRAIASAADSAEAYVGSGVIAGKATVLAENVADVEATAENPGKYTGIDISICEVNASIGQKQSFEDPDETPVRQTAIAYVEDGAIIRITTGDFSLEAKNTGSVQSGYLQGTSITLIDVQSAFNRTFSYYDTRAYVGENARVSVRGAFNMKASDMASAKVKNDSSTIGLVMKAENMATANSVDSLVGFSIGKNAAVDAFRGIALTAFSNANMSAIVIFNQENFAFLSKSLLSVDNVLRRRVKGNICAGAVLTAMGDITLSTKAGENDKISTSMEFEEATAVPLSGTRVMTDVSAYSQIDLGAGARIESPFKTVNIIADVHEGDVKTSSQIMVFEIFGGPTPVASTILNLHASVVIAPIGNRTRIEGDYINIAAKAPLVNADAAATLYSGAGGDKEARGDLEITTNFSVLLKNVDIIAYTIMNLIAENQSIAARQVLTLHYVGSVTGESEKLWTDNITCGGSATIDLGEGTVLTAGVVNLKTAGTDKIAISLIHYGYEVNASEKTEERKENSNQAGIGRISMWLFVDSSAAINLGPGMTGVKVCAYQDQGNDYFLITGGFDLQEAIPSLGNGNYAGWRKLGDLVYMNEALPELRYYQALNVTGAAPSITPNIYWTSLCTSYEIINDISGCDIIIHSTLALDGRFTAPSSNVAANITDITASRRIEPLLIITSLRGQNVRLDSDIMNPLGNTHIRWIGERGSLLGGMRQEDGVEAPAVWTRDLTIQNAANVGLGQRADEYLPVWLVSAEEDAGDNNMHLSVDAENIYMAVTPVAVTRCESTAAVAEAAAKFSDRALMGFVVLDNVCAVANASVKLCSPMRVAYNANMYRKQFKVVLPGTVRYLGIEKELYETVTIPDIQRYMTNYNPSELTLEYTFPNRYVVLTNIDGKVLSVTTPTGLVIDAQNYGMSAELPPAIYRDEVNGYSLNLRTGVLTWDDDSKPSEMPYGEIVNGDKVYTLPEGSKIGLYEYLGKQSGIPCLVHDANTDLYLNIYTGEVVLGPGADEIVKEDPVIVEKYIEADYSIPGGTGTVTGTTQLRLVNDTLISQIYGGVYNFNYRLMTEEYASVGVLVNYRHHITQNTHYYAEVVGYYYNNTIYLINAAPDALADKCAEIGYSLTRISDLSVPLVLDDNSEYVFNDRLSAKIEGCGGTFKLESENEANQSITLRPGNSYSVARNMSGSFIAPWNASQEVGERDVNVFPLDSTGSSYIAPGAGGRLHMDGVISIKLDDIKASGAVVLPKGQQVLLEYVSENVAKSASNDAYGVALNSQGTDTALSGTYYQVSPKGYYKTIYNLDFFIIGVYEESVNSARVFKKFFPQFGDKYDANARASEDFYILMHGYEATAGSLAAELGVALLRFTDEEATRFYFELPDNGYEGYADADGSFAGAVGVDLWQHREVSDGNRANGDYGDDIRFAAVSAPTEYHIALLSGENVWLDVENPTAELRDGDLVLGVSDNADLRAKALVLNLPAGGDLGDVDVWADAVETTQRSMPAPGNARWEIEKRLGTADAKLWVCWDEVPGAAGYIVKLYRDGAFVGSVDTAASVTSHDFHSFIRLLGYGNYTFEVIARNPSAGSADSAPSILSRIYSYEKPEFATEGRLATGTLGKDYVSYISISGEEGTWDITAGELPQGLIITPNPEYASLDITGKPTQAGVYTFTVRFTGLFETVEKDFTISVTTEQEPVRVELKTAPKLVYIEGETLDLSDLVLLVTPDAADPNNRVDLPFDAATMTVSIADGTPLTRNDYLRKISLQYGNWVVDLGELKVSYAENLYIGPSPLMGSQDYVEGETARLENVQVNVFYRYIDGTTDTVNTRSYTTQSFPGTINIRHGQVLTLLDNGIYIKASIKGISMTSTIKLNVTENVSADGNELIANACVERLSNIDWTLAMETANDIPGVEAWIESQILALLGTGAAGMVGADASVDTASFRSAIAGSESARQGTDGVFNFTVSFTAGTGGEAKTATAPATGSLAGRITATEYSYFDTDVSYQVDYNGGGGATPANVYQRNLPTTAYQNIDFCAPDCKFIAPENKRFAGWDWNGTTVQPGELLRIDANTTLTALWTNVAVQSLSLTTAPNLTYKDGDSLDFSSFSALATMDDGSQRTIGLTDVSFSIAQGTALNMLHDERVMYFTYMGVDGLIGLLNVLSNNTDVEDVTFNGQSLQSKTDGSFKISVPAAQMPDIASASSLLPGFGVELADTHSAVTAMSASALANGVKLTMTVTAESGVTRDVELLVEEEPMGPTNVADAKTAIEKADWGTEMATANSASELKALVEQTLGAMLLTDVTYTVTIKSVSPATAGSLENLSGAGGSYTFIVALSSGAATGTANGSGSISAAVYTPKSCTISFANGGGEGRMNDQTVTEGNSLVLPVCGFLAPTGQQFDAWSINGLRCDAGDAIRIFDDTRLTPLWKAVTSTGVAVGGSPKLVYQEGDVLDTSGLSFQKIYSDGTSVWLRNPTAEFSINAGTALRKTAHDQKLLTAQVDGDTANIGVLRIISNDSGIGNVNVNGSPVTWQNGTDGTAVLPYGSTLPMNAAAFNVSTSDPDASTEVSEIDAENGIWQITVTAENGTVTSSYTVSLTVSTTPPIGYYDTPEWQRDENDAFGDGSLVTDQNGTAVEYELWERMPSQDGAQLRILLVRALTKVEMPVDSRKFLLPSKMLSRLKAEDYALVRFAYGDILVELPLYVLLDGDYEIELIPASMEDLHEEERALLEGQDIVSPIWRVRVTALRNGVRTDVTNEIPGLRIAFRQSAVQHLEEGLRLLHIAKEGDAYSITQTEPSTEYLAEDKSSYLYAGISHSGLVMLTFSEE